MESTQIAQTLSRTHTNTNTQTTKQPKQTHPAQHTLYFTMLQQAQKEEKKELSSCNVDEHIVITINDDGNEWKMIQKTNSKSSKTTKLIKGTIISFVVGVALILAASFYTNVNANTESSELFFGANRQILAMNDIYLGKEIGELLQRYPRKTLVFRKRTERKRSRARKPTTQRHHIKSSTQPMSPQIMHPHSAVSAQQRAASQAHEARPGSPTQDQNADQMKDI